jgi:pectin methylesterase-like acyl-CoA thioesterase
MNGLWCHCRCIITGNGGSSYAYLGRPWGPYGRVVFAFTYMDQCIKPEGWNNWGNTDNENSACFYEFRYQIVHHIAFICQKKIMEQCLISRYNRSNIKAVLSCVEIDIYFV